jgi:hypothetical protein
MKKVIRITESDMVRIIRRIINESKEYILSEQWGSIAKKALSWVGKNEDDIATLFKTSEKALAQNMDEIVGTALKSKNIAQLDDIQMKLMHFYNPSGLKENIPAAQQQMKNFLNGYSKSKGKASWKVFREEITGTTPPKTAQGTAQASSQASSQAVRDIMKGQRVSNRWYGFTDPSYSKYINWDGITNAKNMEDYNKIIAKAIKTGDYQYVSRSGFEKFGIPNFREYLQKNIDKVKVKLEKFNIQKSFVKDIEKSVKYAL